MVVAKIFLMIRYPMELGSVEESDFDYLLKTISECQALWSIACTIAAVVTTSEDLNQLTPTSQNHTHPPSPTRVSSLVSRYEALKTSRTAGASTNIQTSSSVSSFSVMSAGETRLLLQGFYCKSALPYIDCQTTKPSPCVVVDMFQNKDDADMPSSMDKILDVIKQSIYTCILKSRDSCQLSTNDIYILRNVSLS